MRTAPDAGVMIMTRRMSEQARRVARRPILCERAKVLAGHSQHFHHVGGVAKRLHYFVDHDFVSEYATSY